MDDVLTGACDATIIAVATAIGVNVLDVVNVNGCLAGVKAALEFALPTP